MVRKLIIYLILSFTFLGIASAEDMVINVNTTWSSGEYTYDNVTITNGATLIFDGVVTLNATNLTIAPDSSISADGKGYGPGFGQGAGSLWESGGSYGGEGGGYRVTPTYGSAIAPAELGSGGGEHRYGADGSGGGVIRLIVKETLTLNGKITANGENVYTYGGGSGGSIYVTTKIISGSGYLSANGGNSVYGGGGGGGRISVHYQNSTFPITNALVKGGGGYGPLYGKDGTVAFIDTLNNNFYTGHSFRFQENDSPFNFNKVILNNSDVTSQGNINLNANDLIIENKSNLALDSVATVTINNSINLNTTSTLILSGKEILTADGIILTNNSIITHLPQGQIYLNVLNLTIDSTSSISADGKGYGSASGPGAGLNDRAGGSYGGEGGKGAGTLRAPTYGSSIAPVDLGSGGRGWYDYWRHYVVPGGSGGGIIRLIVTNTLILNGKITANGLTGGDSSGGGSGGSIYVTATTISGTGYLIANGSDGDPYRGYGSGGGGGRIAVYYQNSMFPVINVNANGGKGGRAVDEDGEDGTIIFQGPSLDTSLAFFNLIEKSATISTFSESLLSKKATSNNISVIGDLNGTLNFTDFEIVNIDTGSFAGKGFSEGEFIANLGDFSYDGYWKGISYFIQSENKIYLKGGISGYNISGVVEGYLTESISGSNIYDKYYATWKLNRLDAENVSVTLDLEGNLFYQSSDTFTSELYLYQANMEGSTYGDYTGPLSAVLTHLRITSENDYKGDGFSIISYNTNLGSGEGWSYNQLVSSTRTELQGLFNEPLSGKLSAFLEENKSPKTLSGTIERMDLGEEPVALLSVKVWGPQRVSPGQKIDYIIEYRNDGLRSAPDVAVVIRLSPFIKYISGSPGDLYAKGINEIAWDLGDLPAKTVGYLSVQGEIIWGLPDGMILSNNVYIESFQWHSEEIGNVRNGVNLPSKEYIVTICNPMGCTNESMSAEELKQFKCPELSTCVPNQMPQYKSWRSVGSKYNSDWQPILNTEGDPLALADALHAALSSPIFGDGEGNPVPTDFNGLKRDYEILDYTIEYSGGNPVGDGALKLGKDTLKTSEGKIFTKYKVSPMLFDPDILLPLYKESGVGKVVLYQSEYDDLLPYNAVVSYDKDYGWEMERDGIKYPGIIEEPLAKLSGASEVIHTWERETQKQIEWFIVRMTTQPDGEYGKDSVSIKISGKEETIIFFFQGNRKTGDLFKQSDFANVEGIEIEVRDRSQYKISHTDWQTWILNCEDILTGIIDKKSTVGLFGTTPSIITTARDPNEKLVLPVSDVRPGDILNYTINYENEGEGIAYGVYITDTLDSDLNDSTLVINNNGSYDASTRTITWFIGEVWSHQKGSVTFSINTKPDLTDGTEVINFATVYFPSVPEVTRTNGTVNRVVTAVLDTTPPETIFSVFPVANQRGWNNTDVTSILTAEDASGIKEIHYILTGAETREEIVSGNTAQIIVSMEGITNLSYWTVDNVGNVETPKTLEIKIDKTLPFLIGTILPEPNFFGWNNTDVTVIFIATDNLSGVAVVTEPVSVTVEGANQYIVGEAIDIADNRETTYVTVNIDRTPPQVNITANPNLLWPSNRKIVNASIGGSAQDTLSGIASTTFEFTDEYNTVEPTISDFNVIIQLEAWRNGDDLNGRTYTITATTKDKADNQISTSATVVCPHDQRKK